MHPNPHGIAHSNVRFCGSSRHPGFGVCFQEAYQAQKKGIFDLAPPPLSNSKVTHTSLLQHTSPSAPPPHTLLPLSKIQSSVPRWMTKERRGLRAALVWFSPANPPAVAALGLLPRDRPDSRCRPLAGQPGARLMAPPRGRSHHHSPNARVLVGPPGWVLVLVVLVGGFQPRCLFCAHCSEGVLGTHVHAAQNQTRLTLKLMGPPSGWGEEEVLGQLGEFQVF